MQQSKIAAIALVTCEMKPPHYMLGNVSRMTVTRARQIHRDEKTLGMLRAEVDQILRRGVCQGVHWKDLLQLTSDLLSNHPCS